MVVDKKLYIAVAHRIWSELRPKMVGQRISDK